MQYINFQLSRSNQWQSSQLTKYLLLVLGCFLAWFEPYTHDLCVMLDEKTFILLNSSLQYSHLWRLFWGYLSHPYEVWLNLVLMIGLNILGIFTLPRTRRPAAFAGVLYFWLFFQIVITITHGLFTDCLMLRRISPSWVMTPFINLAAELNMPELKVLTDNCFPAGHALVLIFWAKFTLLYSKEWLHKIVLATTIIFILPRLITGAHWVTDVIFTIFYALLCFEIAISNPLYALTTNSIEKFIKKIGFAT